VARIVPVDWTVYGALIAGFLAICAGIAVVVVRILDAWRTLKRLRRHMGKELDRLADLGEQAAEKAATATDTSALDARLARLRATLARFAVLGEAFDEAKSSVTRVAAVYPRK